MTTPAAPEPTPEPTGLARLVAAGRPHLVPAVVLMVATAVVAAPVLLRLSAPGASSDILAHATMAAENVREGGGISYSTWFPLLHVLAGGSEDLGLLRRISLVLLMLAVAGKVLGVYAWATHRALSRTGAVGVALLLLVAMPLVDPARPRLIYIGQISATLWHNATHIFSVPFSLAAFAAAVALLRAPSVRTAGLFGVAALLSTAAKPNYALALLPVVGVALLVVVVRRRMPVRSAAAVLALAGGPVLALLVYQYLVVFSGDSAVRETDMVLAPFVTWHVFTPSILRSLVLSLAGPLVAALVLPRSVWRQVHVWLSWAVLAVALVMTALLGEEGPGGVLVHHGNAFWGSHLALLVVFLVTATELVRRLASWRELSRPRLAAAALAVLLLLGHGVSGAYYAANAGVDGFPVTMETG